jgi:hypothetical protein
MKTSMRLHQTNTVMKTKRLLVHGALLLALSLLSLEPLTALAQPTAFSFQGRLLNPNGTPANGPYDFQFYIYDVPSGNGQFVVGPLPVNGVDVANGVFSTTVDPQSGVFTGPDRYVQMFAAPANSGNFQPVPDRVKVLSAPYALLAGTADAVKSGAAVTSLSGLKDDVVIQGSACISVTKAGNTIMLDCANGGGGNYWLQNGSSIYYNAGNVGIGTSAPQANLHLYNPADSATHLIETAGGDNAWSKVQFKNLNGQWDIGTSRNFVGDVFYIDRIGTSPLEFTLAPSGNVGLSAAPANDTRLTLYTTPNTPFAVPHYGIEHTDGNVRLATFLTLNTAGLGTRSNHPLNFFVNDGSASMTIDTSGRVGIGTPSPQAKLDVEGTTRTCVLTITGGCDLAEPFPVEDVASKGAVLVIDDDYPGRLKLSQHAYDTRVAGIISGANGVNAGISLQQDALGTGQNVALSGRVYVQADASYGPIRAGDLLTTSDTPGYAMKVTDHGRAQGAILGKAMGSLSQGKGLVLVLVTLE